MVQQAERAAMSGTLVPSAEDADAESGSPPEPAGSAQADAHAAAAAAEDAGAAEAEALAPDEPRGLAPSVPSFHAYIHAHAVAHDLR